LGTPRRGLVCVIDQNQFLHVASDVLVSDADFSYSEALPSCHSALLKQCLF
jgi:hypothetical protein